MSSSRSRVSAWDRLCVCAWCPARGAALPGRHGWDLRHARRIASGPRQPGDGRDLDSNPRRGISGDTVNSCARTVPGSGTVVVEELIDEPEERDTNNDRH